MDNYKIRITGTGELDTKAEYDKDITITKMQLGFVSANSKPNHDDTGNTIVYTFSPNSFVDFTQEGKTMKADYKNKKSKALRQACWCIKQDDGYYDLFMGKLLANLEEVIEFLEQR